MLISSKWVQQRAIPEGKRARERSKSSTAFSSESSSLNCRIDTAAHFELRHKRKKIMIISQYRSTIRTTTRRRFGSVRFSRSNPENLRLGQMELMDVFSSPQQNNRIKAVFLAALLKQNAFVHDAKRERERQHNTTSMCSRAETTLPFIYSMVISKH
jgi:hypothetical protein